MTEEKRNLEKSVIISASIHGIIILLIFIGTLGIERKESIQTVNITLVSDAPEPVVQPQVTQQVSTQQSSSQNQQSSQAASSNQSASSSSAAQTQNFDDFFNDSSSSSSSAPAASPLGFDDSSLAVNNNSPGNDFFSNDTASFVENNNSSAANSNNSSNSDTGFDSSVLDDLSNKSDEVASSSSSSSTSSSSTSQNSNAYQAQDHSFVFVDGKRQRMPLSYTPPKLPDNLILDVPTVKVTYEFVILPDGSPSDLQLIGQTGYPIINAAVADSIRSMVFSAADSSEVRRITFTIKVGDNGN